MGGVPEEEVIRTLASASFMTLLVEMPFEDDYLETATFIKQLLVFFSIDADLSQER